jgi:predicted helicase
VIGFVTNAGFLEANTADGLRQCLYEEFSSIYVFHLRGNARTSGELRRKEKDNVFGSGSRAPIAISLLVKNPYAAHKGQIHFHDIGDYLTREEKLTTISELGSIGRITQQNAWRMINPDEHGDWLSQRRDDFSEFMVLGNKKTEDAKIFDSFSLGLGTNRDAWCYNYSRANVEMNIGNMIAHYNQELQRFNQTHKGLDKKFRDTLVNEFINTDPRKISWTRSLKQDLAKNRTLTFDVNSMVLSMYRPYSKQWVYFNREVNEYLFQMPRIFPNAQAENLVICVSGVGARSGFSTLISNALPCLDNIEKGQCFPLYLYDIEDHDDEGKATPSRPTGAPQQSGLFSEHIGDLFEAAEAASPSPSFSKTSNRRHAITDAGLAHFQSAYPNESIAKEDVFYYVYGLLHSRDYREKYADNLSKELPRIPCVSTAADFWAFTKAGRALANLHLNYESVEPYAATVQGDTGLSPEQYRVEKMRYGKKGKDKDLSIIHYNALITVSGIPLDAYEYVVNGKPAINWVMERQAVKTDKDSGITNDANDWAIETMGQPRYPLDLLLRVITVSLETTKIVQGLPVLDV